MAAGRRRESILNLAFANKIKSSPEFAHWLLGKTKFKGSDASVILARGDWPWYQSKSTGVQSETDILIVFQQQAPPERFALHIENKQLKDKFRPNQPELYHIRAKDWLGLPKWGGYKDYEVLLIAPLEFYHRNQDKCDTFHRYIAYEEVAEFIAEFAA